VGRVTGADYVEGHGPQAYERFLVPAVFADCATALLDAAEPRPGERVLDIACGTGIVARRAASRARLGLLVGCDLNESMLDVARSIAIQPDVDWYHADAVALPFEAGRFDVVYCQQGLQYVGDPLAGLREMARVLVPGGRVALALWRSIEHSPGYNLLVGSLRHHVGTEAAEIMLAPFASPGAEELRRMLAQAGFDDALVRIGVLAARFPSPREFVRRQVLASPRDGLARLAEQAPAGAEPLWEEVAQDMDGRLSPYVDDGGVVLPMQTWLVTARRGAPG
jgi:ubiquinone/menaquinone biosynthesis C-methylase UbiE